MCDDKNRLPQVSTSLTESNLIVGSDRVKASVASAGPTDSGGDHSHMSLCDSGGAGVDRLSPSTPTDTSEEGKRTLTSYFKKINDSPEALKEKRCSVLTGTQGVIQIATPPYTETNLDRLGKQVDRLLDYIKDRHNVHHEIKRMAHAIKTSLEKVQEEVDTRICKTATGAAASTQTSPVFARKKRMTEIQAEQEQAMVEEMPTPSKQSAKRKKETPPPLVQPAKKPATSKKMKKKKEKEKGGNLVVEHDRNAASNQDQTEWQVVRKKKAESRRKPARSNALILQSKGDTTYADILRKVKNDPNLQEVGKKVNKIRRTAAGDLLFVFGKTDTQEILKFREAVETTLASDANIMSRTPETEIEIKDLDEVATKEDVANILANYVEGLTDITADTVKSLRRAYGQTQTAVVRLPDNLAKKAVRVGKLRLPWGTVRIRERVKPTRCMRCWHYGHLAKSCKGDVDRYKNCYKCGNNNHIASRCTNTPSCLLCKEKGSIEDAGHVAGSWKCPIYQRALKAAKSRK